MLNFFKNFSKAKMSQAAVKTAEMIARIDPDTVTEAAILEVEDQLKIVTEETAKARMDYEREQKEADEIVSLQEKRISAAEKLNRSLEQDPTNTEIQQALSELLDIIESTAPEVEREKSEAEEAKELLTIMDSNAREIADQLKSLRRTAEQVKKDMQKAEKEKEIALRREERIKVVSGIKKSASGFSTAISAMEDASKTARQEADAAKLRAQLLSPTEKETRNRLIENALNSMTEKSSESISDRLSRLKK